jgi:hypothetical protein
VRSSSYDGWFVRLGMVWWFGVQRTGLVKPEPAETAYSTPVARGDSAQAVSVLTDGLLLSTPPQARSAALSLEPKRPAQRERLVGIW